MTARCGQCGEEFAGCVLKAHEDECDYEEPDEDDDDE